MVALKWTAAIHVSTCYTLHTPCGQLLSRCPHTACAYCTATYVSSYHILLQHRWRRWSDQLPCGMSPTCRRRTSALVLTYVCTNVCIYIYIYILLALLLQKNKYGRRKSSCQDRFATGCKGSKHEYPYLLAVLVQKYKY